MSTMVHREGWLDVTPSMRLFYRDFASPSLAESRAPLIALHGYWRSGKDFIELAEHEHVSERRRVVVPDLRGRGQSSRSAQVSDYEFDRLLDDIKLLYQTLGIERAVLLGTALGAHLALVLAESDPGMVAGIVLNDSGVEAASSSSVASMVKFSGSDEFSYDEIVDRTRRQYEGQFPAFGHDEWVRMALRAHREVREGVWVRDFDQLTNDIFPGLKARFPDFWKEYRAISDIPVALLRGEHSHYLTVDVAERMIAAHPKATLYTIHGSGHAPTLWEPEALEAIDDFLAKVDAAELQRA